MKIKYLSLILILTLVICCSSIPVYAASKTDAPAVQLAAKTDVMVLQTAAKMQTPVLKVAAKMQTAVLKASAKKKKVYPAPSIKKIETREKGIKLTWSKIKKMSAFRVQRKESTAKKWKTIGATKKNSYYDKTALPDKTYMYRVVGINKKHKKITPYSKKITCLPSPKPKVSGTEDKIKIKWKRVSGAEQYAVYRKAEGGKLKKIGTTSKAVFYDTAFEKDTKYTYAVRCLLSDGKTIVSGYNETKQIKIGGLYLEFCEIADTDTINTLSDPVYMSQCFYEKAKSRGWKHNAILGALAYILAEGGGWGVFTYESFWACKGPSGEVYDTTLDNDAWRKWINSDDCKKQMIKLTPKYYSKKHYACGISMLADSNVWDNGVKTVANADWFLDAADAAGVPWQNMDFQIEWALQKLEGASYDPDWRDPTTFKGTAKEYCRRVLAYYGMPGWNYKKEPLKDFVKAHLDMVETAELYCGS